MTVSNIRTGAPIASPSQTIIAEAAKTILAEGGGRLIELRRPSNVTRRNARKAISAESQTKPELFGEYMLVFLVVSIDGESIPVPTNERQAEAIQDRLGDDGLVAIANAVTENFASSAADAVADAKNS